MERNYVGQAAYSGSSVVSAGRRAGTLRSQVPEETANPYGQASSHGTGGDAHAAQPRYGRRASPSASPAVDGMDVEPPRSGSSHGYNSYGAGAGGAASGAGRGIPRPGAAPAAAAAPGGGAPSSSKLAGLARLKEASTARLVSRIPSAGASRTGSAGAGGEGAYVPSAMTHQPPARSVLPGRTPSGGSSSGYGYGNTASAAGGARPASGRSASTGRAMPPPAAAPLARAPSGRSGSGAGVSSGYGMRAGSSTGSGAEYGTSGSGSRPPSNGSASTARGGAGAAPVSLAARRAAAPPPSGPSYGSRQHEPPAAAAPPPARSAPPRAAPPGRSAPPPRAAPPPAPPPKPQPSYSNPVDDYVIGGGGGGGFGGFGGGGFAGGSVPEGAEEADAGPSVECPTCGRTFNEQAYSKHSRICEKVFANKRKPVNMAAKRLEGIPEAAKFFDLKKGAPKSELKAGAGAGAGRPGGGAGAAGGRGARLDDRPLPGSKVPKWKSQSEQLRLAMAANKQIADAKARGVDIRDVAFTPTPAAQDDRVPCPHCGRKFAELTAERHIPKCKDIQAKPGFLAAKGGKGAYARR